MYKNLLKLTITFLSFKNNLCIDRHSCVRFQICHQSLTHLNLICDILLQSFLIATLWILLLLTVLFMFSFPHFTFCYCYCSHCLYIMRLECNINFKQIWFDSIIRYEVPQAGDCSTLQFLNLDTGGQCYHRWLLRGMTGGYTLLHTLTVKHTHMLARQHIHSK